MAPNSARKRRSNKSHPQKLKSPLKKSPVQVKVLRPVRRRSSPLHKLYKTTTTQVSEQSYRQHWLAHDSYRLAASPTRIVTRSQTVFKRIKDSVSNLKLFGDKTRYIVPGRTHLMTAVKGKFGAIPRTIVTRTSGMHLDYDSDLNDKLKPYKAYEGEALEFGTEAHHSCILQ